MRRQSKVVILFVAFCLIFMAVDLSAQQGRGKGRIRGKVVDESGNPLGDVEVFAEIAEFNVSFTGKSNAKGTWAMAGLGTGRFKITFTKEGYDTLVEYMQVSQFTKNNEPLNVTMRKMSSVTATDMPEKVDAAPSIDMTFLEEGNQFYNQEQYREAIAKYEAFLLANPTIFQVYINIGNSYRQLEEWDPAVVAYEKVLELSKDDSGGYKNNEVAARAYSNIGEIFIIKGDFDKANEYLMKAVSLFPDNEVLVFNIGEICFQQGQIDEAIEYYKKSILIKADWGPAYRQLGYAYLNKGEYQLSLESFEKYLEYGSDDSQVTVVERLIPEIKKLIR